MEVTVSKFDLLKELTATQVVVERKTTIPILSNLDRILNQLTEHLTS
jgi:DNA polymerase III sliding clamp (beta) subunit (PCNA family)